MACELYANIATLKENFEKFKNLLLKLKEEGAERGGRRRGTQ